MIYTHLLADGGCHQRRRSGYQTRISRPPLQLTQEEAVLEDAFHTKKHIPKQFFL